MRKYERSDEAYSRWAQGWGSGVVPRPELGDPVPSSSIIDNHVRDAALNIALTEFCEKNGIKPPHAACGAGDYMRFVMNTLAALAAEARRDV